MTNTSSPVYSPPAVVARTGLPLWAPGLRLMRRLELRYKALVLLLCTALPLLLALLLLGAPLLPQDHALRWLL